MNPDFPPGAPDGVLRRWEQTHAAWPVPERVLHLTELAPPGPVDRSVRLEPVAALPASASPQPSRRK